jgi:hypothetical protein
MVRDQGLPTRALAVFRRVQTSDTRPHALIDHSYVRSQARRR